MPDKDHPIRTNPVRYVLSILFGLLLIGYFLHMTVRSASSTELRCRREAPGALRCRASVRPLDTERVTEARDASAVIVGRSGVKTKTYRLEAATARGGVVLTESLPGDPEAYALAAATLTRLLQDRDPEHPDVAVVQMPGSRLQAVVYGVLALATALFLALIIFYSQVGGLLDRISGKLWAKAPPRGSR